MEMDGDTLEKYDSLKELMNDDSVSIVNVDINVK